MRKEEKMNKVILQAHDLFKTAGFDYAICGGFGLDMFAGREIRTHGDFDIAIFAEDKRRAVQFLLDNDWPVYGRFGEVGPIWQYLFYKINDILDNFWDDLPNVWSVKHGGSPEMFKLERLLGDGRIDVYSYKQPSEWHVKELNFIELGFDKREDGDYVAQENPRVALPMDKAILYRDGIPYLAPEITLFYKSGKSSMEGAYAKPRTIADYKAIMPMLSDRSKKWLLDSIDATYPDGYGWLDGLLCN